MSSGASIEFKSIAYCEWILQIIWYKFSFHCSIIGYTSIQIQFSSKIYGALIQYSSHRTHFYAFNLFLLNSVWFRRENVFFTNRERKYEKKISSIDRYVCVCVYDLSINRFCLYVMNICKYICLYKTVKSPKRTEFTLFLSPMWLLLSYIILISLGILVIDCSFNFNFVWQINCENNIAKWHKIYLQTQH